VTTAPEDDPRELAAAAMRRLGHAMVAHDADEELLRRLARQAHATADVVEASPRRSRDARMLKRQIWEDLPPSGERMAHFDECIVSGPANPMGVLMDVRRAGDRVEGRIHLGAAFEGAPKRAHGGIVAAILDDIMGYVMLVNRTPAFTGTLEVRYAAPTPVQADLLATAWLEGQEGRKIHIASTLADAEGAVLAEGRGLFITIPPERFRDEP
jgi:acyl-coenzyme A thioesterase PaaI-like protein